MKKVLSKSKKKKYFKTDPWIVQMLERKKTYDHDPNLVILWLSKLEERKIKWSQSGSNWITSRELSGMFYCFII